MPATQVGLVYSIARGYIRSIVVPDDNSQLPSYILAQGEAMSIITMIQFNRNDLNGLQALLNARTGITPSGNRYASVDAGSNVTRIDTLDPTGCRDDLVMQTLAPNHTLVAHDTANPGDLLAGGQVVTRNPQQFVAFSYIRVFPPLIGRANQIAPQMS